jgi:ABC-2 type transport system permease protein
VRTLRRYGSLTVGQFMTNLAYPVGFFFTFLGNLIYIAILYFLWKAVYGASETLHGMSFNQTFLFLTLAGSIIILFQTNADRIISWRILSGGIVIDLTKPLDFQLQSLAHQFGTVLFNGLVITIPSMIVVLLLVPSEIPVGLNIPFFLVSLLGAYTLSYMLDFMIGLLAFYTESLWGISATKDVLTSFLAGALVPLAFFPESMQQILGMLPFQAIYNVPLQIATNAALNPVDYVQMLGVQIFWVIVFALGSRLFFRHVIARLTINGG